MESKWLASVRQFLHDIEGHIHLRHNFVAPLQRQDDAFIMDMVISTNKFTPAQTKRINYCRMHLGVLLLSDIATAAGNNIIPSIYSGENASVSILGLAHRHKVHQKCPNDKAWAQWRRFLHMITTSKQSLQLKVPMGRWLLQTESLRRKWFFLYDPSTDLLFHRQPDNTYTTHTRLAHDYNKDTSDTVSTPPDTAVPVDIKARQQSWKIMGWKLHRADILLPTPTPSSITDIMPTMDDWEQHLLRNITFLVDEEEVWNVLTTRSCIIASDGSAPGPKGSFGWVISDRQGNHLVQCNGPTFGAKISSYRAEGYGILSALRFLARMRQVFYRDPPEDADSDSDSTCSSTHESPDLRPPTLICDNESMVNTANKIYTYSHIYPNATMDSEYDVLAEIRASMTELQGSCPSLEWIKGHQDDHTELDKLPLKAQLNCHADTLANEYLTSNPTINFLQVPMLPTSGCHLQLAKGTVTYNIKHEVKLARTTPPLKKKLCAQHAWDDETFEDIDWTSHGRALNYQQKHRITMVKYLNDCLPLGKRVHRYNIKYPETCPSCPAPLEDSDHFWSCPATSRNKWRKTCHKALLDQLNELDTAPPLQALLLEAAKAVLQGTPLDNIAIEPEVQHVADAQANIGWHQLFKGRFSKSWKQVQDQYLGTRKTKRNTGQTWLTKVINTIFQEWWKLWELRNEDLHGRDLNTRTQAETRQGIRELTHLYQAHHDIAPLHLQWLFDIPLITRMQYNISTIRQWINRWKPILERSYQTELETG